ncbi:MAG: six-cysteine peptide SCIFF [Clostridiales bacterium]|nr:six-cysteine peptide SCIFF [Clostridiales bacterium]
MKSIKTITTRNMVKSQSTGGCGECQTSCQSASKTSCSVANQHCEQHKDK